MATSTKPATRHQTLIELIANTLQARTNCAKSGNQLWFDKHSDLLDHVAKDLLPSGAGIDNGTKIDLDRSSGDCVRFTLGFHHMDQAGYYAGWTEHIVAVRPAFVGRVAVNVTGQNRNGIKDYIAEVFSELLTRAVTVEYDKATEVTSVRFVAGV